jgi:hypothetical protein
MNLAKRTKTALATALVGAGVVLALLSNSSPAVAFFSGGLFLDVTVQSPAHLVAKGAAVTVPVQVTCNATQTAFVSVQVTERVGKQIASGFGSAQVGCTGGHQALLLTVTASGGKTFVKGQAFASADLFGCSSFCASEHGESTISIQR